MNTKVFFNEMRKIIREEVQLAMKQVLTESTSQQKKPMGEKAVQPVAITSNSTLQELLNETAISMKNKTDDETFSFDSSDAKSFGYGDMFTRGREATPKTIEVGGQHIQATEVGEAVVNALTKDYSALMKAMAEKAKKKNR